MHNSKNTPLGSLYLILGLILFVLVAGAFIVRLLLALFALWMVMYGLKLCNGGETYTRFWRSPRD